MKILLNNVLSSLFTAIRCNLKASTVNTTKKVIQMSEKFKRAKWGKKKSNAKLELTANTVSNKSLM
jgi:hypothetical protein